MVGQKKWIVWDDWSGGEFGDIPLRQVQDNQFTALNLLVYRNGELGPRPGIKTHPNTSIDTGFIRGLGYTGTAGAFWWAAIGTTINGYNNVSGPAWFTGTGAATGGANAVVLGINTVPSEQYIANPTDAVFSLDTSGGAGTLVVSTVPNHASATSGVERAMAMYRDRLYIADADSIFYSAPNNFGDWSSTSYFKVGHGKGIRFMGTQRDALMIVTADGSIWAYRGSPGSDSLRRVYNGARHPWVFFPGKAIVLPNDEFIMIPVQRDYPAVFTGGKLIEFRHLKMLDGKEGNAAGDADEWGIVSTYQDDGVLILSGLTHPTTGNHRAMERRDGVWHMYEWGESLSAVAASDQQGQVLLTNGGGAGSSATFFTYDPSIDRPGYTSDTYANVGDNSPIPETNMEMTTGAWWADEGHEITINKIIVDFTKYQTGQSATTHFGVNVVQYAEHLNDATRTVAMQSFDQANSQATTAGEQDRYISGGPSGGAVPCSGFQINLDAIRAVGIQSIRVEIEQNPKTPRY